MKDTNILNFVNYPYYPYSEWLKTHYGERVYKIPINIGCGCPNRDGVLDDKGCIFCGESGGSSESLSKKLSVTDQLSKNKSYIGQRYKVKKFIPFFQNYTNTYLPLKQLKSHLESCLANDVVAIAISTRPDCVTEEQLDFFETFSSDNHVDICIELGLQTANYHTLKRLNRHHGLGDFIDASFRIKKRNLQLCVHTILDLPWDDFLDVCETAEIISGINADFVKCHALFIERKTLLEEMYRSGDVTLLTVEDYLDRAILFLSYLDENIAVQRIIGRIPEKDSVVSNWHMGWWKVRDLLIKRMRKEQVFQGSKRKIKQNTIIEKLL